jgi:gliding motility-associated-like protein
MTNKILLTILFLLSFLSLSSKLISQGANCEVSDTINSGLLQISGLKQGETFRVVKQVADSFNIYILGEVNGGQEASNSFILTSINNNSGLPIWSKRWVSAGNNAGQINFALFENHLYVTDIIRGSIGLSLIKINNQGDLLWSKQYDFDNLNTNYRASYAPFISIDHNEILISFRIDCIGSNCEEDESILEGLITAGFTNEGIPIWSKLFGVKANSDNAFFNNRALGLYKTNIDDQYIMLSQTSGWPFKIQGNPPVNNYWWAVATRFSSSTEQSTYKSKYYLPNQSGIRYSSSCFGTGRPAFTKLNDGSFMLYSHNINNSVADQNKGFFFLKIDEALNPGNAIIASTKSYPCSSTPLIMPSGKIILGNAGGLLDSFSVATILDSKILFEKKYPKYQHPSGRFNSTYLSALDIINKGKLFIFLNNQLASNNPYSEVFNDNINIEKPQCTSQNITETTVAPISVYSNDIIWDTMQSLQILEKTLPVIENGVSLNYETNCKFISRCDSVLLIAPDTVCVGQEFQIILRKNKECKKQIEVFQKGLNATFIGQVSDSVYVMRAGNSGVSSFGARFKDCPLQTLTSKEVFATNSLSNPFKLLVTDTVLCPGTTLKMDGPVGYKSYKWKSNNSIIDSSSIVINRPGVYILEVINYCNLKFADTVLVKYDSTDLQFSQQAVTICLGDTVSIKYSSDSLLSAFNWNPTQSAKIILPDALFMVWPTENTLFTLKANSKYNCDIEDIITVNIRNLPETIGVLNNAYQLCKEDSLIIKTNVTYPKYLWSSGDTTNQTLITEAGKYYVTIYDENGCKGKVDFEVREIICNDTLYFPTAFTPNGDGLNDKFKPAISGRLPTSYELKIYNRWGKLIFWTTDINIGWDGRIKGIMQSSGNYIWQCKLEFPGNKKRLSKGNFMLIK